MKYFCMVGLVLIIVAMLFHRPTSVEGFASSAGYAGLLGWPAPSSGDNTTNIALIKEALKGKETGGKMIGGWVLAAYSNPSLWGTDATVNTLLPGGFQGDPSVLPNPDVKGTSNTFLTLGGDGVGAAGDCSGEDFIDAAAKWVNDNKPAGICFDAEGCYGGQLADTVSDLSNNVIPKLKEKVSAPLKYILCPLGDLDAGSIPSRDKCKAFDFLAPMLYYGNTTYDSKGISDIKGWLERWESAGWKKNEIILTYQSVSAATSKNGPAVLNGLAAMLVGTDPGPVPPSPPGPPAPPGPSKPTTRCGSDWSDANTNCHKACATKEDCTSAGMSNCFADLDPSPCDSVLSDQKSKHDLAEKLF